MKGKFFKLFDKSFGVYVENLMMRIIHLRESWGDGFDDEEKEMFYYLKRAKCKRELDKKQYDFHPKEYKRLLRKWDSADRECGHYWVEARTKDIDPDKN